MSNETIPSQGCKAPFVSIVVPVHNSKSFLSHCLDSLLIQTLDNLEIIIVNDGSTDGSQEIIEAYCRQDARVRSIVLPQNGGLFAARLAGVAAATGDYIAFADSDDFVTIDLYRLLYEKAVQAQADIVVTDFLVAGQDGSLNYYNLDPLRSMDLDLCGKQIMDAFMEQQGLFYGWHTIWNKLYRRTLWQSCFSRFEAFSHRAGHLVMTEDLAFSSLLWHEAGRVVNIHGAYYCYLQHGEQSTRNTDFAQFKRNLHNVATVFDFFEQQCRGYSKQFSAWKELYICIWLDEARKCGRADEAMKLVRETLGTPQNNTARIDGFYYAVTTDCTQAVKQSEEIKAAIAHASTVTVSFDLFDTLISRPFLHPTDLFVLLNTDWNHIAKTSSFVDFAGMRIRAEQCCRRETKSEVTLQQIYDQIGAMCALSPQQLQAMQLLESAGEVRYCSLRHAGVELLELARYKGKRIVITSDMYLPRAVLETILQPISGWQKLYLSCEEGKTKHDGSLFGHLLADQRLKPKQVVHIGDNSYSDVQQARRLGIQAFLFPGAAQLLLSSPLYQAVTPLGKTVASGNAMEFLGIRCLLGVAANRLFDNPFTHVMRQDTLFNAEPVVVGCAALGFHLYAVAAWLLQQDAPKIHFVARDGYLPKMAYDLIAGGKASNYLYLSRRALLKADIAGPVDLPSLTNKMNALNQTPYSLYAAFESCMKLGLSDYTQYCEESGYNTEAHFETVQQFEAFLLFFGELVDFTQLATQNGRLRDYMQQLICPGQLLFDIGYSGRCELVLRQLLGFPVNSCYIHTNNDLADRRGVQGGFSVQSFYPFKPQVTGVLREHLFMEQVGSCVGYDEHCNPILEEFESDGACAIVTKVVQQEALNFVAEVNRFFSPDELPLRGLDASQAYENFICGAGPKDRLMFASLQFEDSLNEAKPICVETFWNEQQERAVSELCRQEDIYINGVYIKLIRRLNRWFPKGGKAREGIKKLAGMVIK